MASSQQGLRLSASVTVLAILLVVSHAVPVGAEPTEVTTGWPGPEFTLSTSIKPRAVSRTKPTPVALGLEARLAPPMAYPHPPQLGQIKMLLDRHLSVSTRGLPSCAPHLRVEPSLPVRRRCEPALVGDGEVEIYYAFPESKGLPLSAKAFLYNGGTQAGATRLWLYAPVTIPVPSAIIIPIDFKRIDAGHLGIEAVVSMPKVAGGYGRTELLSLNLDREYEFKDKTLSVATFRCANEEFASSAEATFRNEGTYPDERGEPVSADSIRTCAASQ